MKLFIIYIGGKHKNSLIEVHDIRFVAADTIEDAWPVLRAQWWGTPDSLHLDCWGVLRQVNGYDIHLKEFPPTSENRLYFVNLGGYDNSQFTELHKNICVVATNIMDAKEKAKQQISDWESPHKDYLHSIEDVFNVQDFLDQRNSPADLKCHPERSEGSRATFSRSLASLGMTFKARNNSWGTKKLYIHLEEAKKIIPFQFVCEYTPIGK